MKESDPRSQERILTGMTDNELRDFICKDLLSVEQIKYHGKNTAEHKILFLIGGAENDVASVRTSRNQLVYFIQPGHPKAPEIAEATAAISFHFEGSANTARVISEVSDIFYNLWHLTQLDPRYGEYEHCIDELSGVLGFSRRDALLVTAAKYNYRLVSPGVKNHEAEDKIIADLMENGSVTKPADKNLIAAYRTLNRMGNDILKPRLQQLQHWTSKDTDEQMNDYGI